MQCFKNVGNAITTKNASNHISKLIKNESIEGHQQHGPEIRTIVIGEQQKIFLSPRVEVRRVVKQLPATLFDHHNISTGSANPQLIDDMEPRIQIITKPMQRALNSPPGLHHVRVIKDGRFYDNHHPVSSRHNSATTSPQIDHFSSNGNNNFHHHQQHQRELSPDHQQQQQHQQSPRKYIVSRQINVISTSDQNVFRTPPVVSSTTQQKQQVQQSQQQMTSMRPPPPPPPIMHRIKTSNSMSEEPSSSIPDLGEFMTFFYHHFVYRYYL